MSGSIPRSNDLKAKVAASVLSTRLKQCWKTDLEWQLIPAQLKEVSYMHKWVHKIRLLVIVPSMYLLLP